ncbi:MAG: DNA methyltransferase [Chloroflexota bacterium]|nr:DNA methyltransferase [Chloroflexota bacterium]MDE2910955.1 DNA methyltransferase [Chloroflexota bacterium]
MTYTTQLQNGNELNRLYEDDRPIHEWYRFVLSFPPHLVRQYVEKFELARGQLILDPFCGTGTTLVEAKKLGLASVGIEANAMAHFAASVKTDWDVEPDGLAGIGSEVRDWANAGALERVHEGGDSSFGVSVYKGKLRTFDPEQSRLLIKNSISPLPLHKVLTLLHRIEQHGDTGIHSHAKLALAKQTVKEISNLRFGPEIGVGKLKTDAPVIEPWLNALDRMIGDLRNFKDKSVTPATVFLADSRDMCRNLAPCSVDAVITSPPYPNEKDYSRTTRLESVLLGFLSSREDLRRQKHKFIRSNTRGVYISDEDHHWVQHIPRIEALADSIEERRLELGKTSGFEKQYAKVVRLYFGGMARHLSELRLLLRPGAKLAYVVGDQASYFRILIRTGQLLAEVAERLGYEVLDIDLFRTRFSTATKNHLREEVLLLQWNG